MRICFNPRAPCGARHVFAFVLIVVLVFQSTRPVWGATINAAAHISKCMFQSTRPVWGAT